MTTQPELEQEKREQMDAVLFKTKGAVPCVETKAGVAWVPAPPTRLIGRGWPELGAAWSTIWC